MADAWGAVPEVAGLTDLVEVAWGRGPGAAPSVRVNGVAVEVAALSMDLGRRLGGRASLLDLGRLEVTVSGFQVPVSRRAPRLAPPLGPGGAEDGEWAGAWSASARLVSAVSAVGPAGMAVEVESLRFRPRRGFAAP